MNDELLDSERSNQGIAITPELESYFKESAKWGSFLAIIGFVFCALMVIVGLFMAVLFTSAMSSLSDSGPMGLMSGPLVGVLYILLAGIYFFPSRYLYRFAKNLKVARTSGDQSSYIESFKNLKSLFKFMGIFMVIILAFYAIIFIVASIAGVAGLGGGATGF